MRTQPSWSALAAAVPSASIPQPLSIDFMVSPRSVFSSARPTLFRETNGWCPYSARVWLAMELKEIDYDTVRIDIGVFGGRPSGMSEATPQVQWVDGSTMSGSLAILRELDRRFPLSRPLFSVPGADAGEVERLAVAYHSIFPARGGGSDGDPMLIDSPRADFEAAAEATDRLLSQRPEGPYFCGAALSAADVAWAPFLERHAAWLPYLHPGLCLRDGRWAHLSRWLRAMSAEPAYACRVEGDVASWWKVLAFSPGWLVVPRRGWSPPALGASRGGGASLSARSRVSAPCWGAYAARRPHVAAEPAVEAAAHLTRHRGPIGRDACRALELGKEDIDEPMRVLVWLLAGGAAREAAVEAALEAADAAANAAANAAAAAVASGEGGDGEAAALLGLLSTRGLAELTAHLDERVCVPRDLGAPAAAALSRAAFCVSRATRRSRGRFGGYGGG